MLSYDCIVARSYNENIMVVYQASRALHAHFCTLVRRIGLNFARGNAIERSSRNCTKVLLEGVASRPMLRLDRVATRVLTRVRKLFYRIVHACEILTDAARWSIRNTCNDA